MIVENLAKFFYLLFTGSNAWTDETSIKVLFQSLIGWFACIFGDGKGQNLSDFVSAIDLTAYNTWAGVISIVLAWFVLTGLIIGIIKLIVRCFDF